MFLYQSENDSHFECPQCGQHGTVPTAHLDAVLQRNKHAVISCTKCMARFAPHAPAADSLRVTEKHHDEDIGAPQMALEETADESSDDEMAISGGALPELQAHWQRHEPNPLAMPQPPQNIADAPSEKSKDVLPLWLQPQSDKKD